MSYVEGNFYRNPGPAYACSDKDEPVPGWGVQPIMAGPEYVGVGGAFGFTLQESEIARPHYATDSGTWAQVQKSSLLPMLGVAAAALVVVAVGVHLTRS